MSSASASSEEIPVKDSPQSKSGKKPAMGMTIITVMLGTWIGLAGAGGVLYFLVKSGKIPVGAAASRSGREAGETQSITLEPVLANLADAGGHAYVRLGLRVEVESDAADGGGSAAEKGATEKGAAEKSTAGVSDKSSSDAGSSNKLESSIRDTVLEVLGRQTSAGLLGPDGKEHLKIELKEAIERGGVRVEVKDLFFTDFLVQI